MERTLILGQTYETQNWKRIIGHILFWLILFYVLAFQLGLSAKSNWVSYIYALKILCVVIIIHYFFTLYAIPNLLTKRKLFTFFISALLTLIGIVLSVYYTFYFLNFTNNIPLELNYISSLYLGNDFFYILTNPVLIFRAVITHNILFFTILIKVTKDLIMLRREKSNLLNHKSKLEQENMKLELTFLKAQIHPHFFFNTLNNIYSLVTDKDEVAANTILRLSDLMRYSLYEANNEKILLQRELEFIDDYIELEKIRHKNYVDVKLEIEGDSKDLLIPPLILVTFLENSFKHGVNNSIDASWVKVEIKIKETELFFFIENSKPPQLHKERVEGGIGIMNVKRRLDLIFPNQYVLKIINNPLTYIVKLNIQLHGKTKLHNRGRRAFSAKLN